MEMEAMRYMKGVPGMEEYGAGPPRGGAGQYLSFNQISADLGLGRPSTRRTKRHVPDSDKDDKYWEKRKRNNEAARRSRENKRRLDCDIRQRIVVLEEEHILMRKEITIIKKKYGIDLNTRFLSVDERGEMVASHDAPPIISLSEFNRTDIEDSSDHTDFATPKRNRSEGSNNGSSGVTGNYSDSPPPSPSLSMSSDQELDAAAAHHLLSLRRPPSPHSLHSQMSDSMIPMKKRKNVGKEYDAEDAAPSHPLSYPLSTPPSLGGSLLWPGVSGSTNQFFSPSSVSESRLPSISNAFATKNDSVPHSAAAAAHLLSGGYHSNMPPAISEAAAVRQGFYMAYARSRMESGLASTTTNSDRYHHQSLADHSLSEHSSVPSCSPSKAESSGFHQVHAQSQAMDARISQGIEHAMTLANQHQEELRAAHNQKVNSDHVTHTTHTTHAQHTQHYPRPEERNSEEIKRENLEIKSRLQALSAEVAKMKDFVMREPKHPNDSSTDDQSSTS